MAEKKENSVDWGGMFQTALQSVSEGATSYYGAQAAKSNATAAAAAAQAQTTAAAAQQAENRRTIYIAAGVAVFGVLALVLITRRK